LGGCGRICAMPNTTPIAAWKSLKEGNERFVAGQPEHPNQSVKHRESLTKGQKPTAAVFGCGDSRVPAELVFDQGLGDIFVVRTAGQVIDSAVLGSLEFAVGALGVSVIVVLGHESCGAVKATLAAIDDAALPGGYVRDLVERVAPSILLGRKEGLKKPAEFEARHAVETAANLLARSTALADAVAAGDLAIVGATYHLADGKVVLHDVHGDVGQTNGHKKA
jgi:carbonic anhydrase